MQSEFSSKFATFNKWLSAQKNINSAYVQRIIRAHERYPSATLKELRGHGNVPLLRKNRLPVYERKWSDLTPRQEVIREMALAVVSLAREYPDKDPVKIAKNYEIPFSYVLKATNTFHQENDRWIVNPTDHIDRAMHIYTNGEDKIIELNDSREASILAKYFDSVRWFIYKGEPQRLLPFQGLTITAADGRKYALETNPQAILSIQERIEEPEFYTIYDI